jgi:prepilin-type N-terminal cleavage/methylation domain-containing protein/prepilin-type processing-associated H-X9-DG protein
MKGLHERPGFSLVELLVVITIIGLIVVILVPALAAAREASRNANCKNNLRQFGIGMHTYADRAGGFLCSGAFDWKRDGVPSEVGWVADMVNNKILVGQMLCPSNPHQVGETFYDLLGDPATPPTGFGCKVDHSGSLPRKLPDGSVAVNPCRIILGTWKGTWTAPWGTTYVGGNSLAAGTEDRRKLVEELVLTPGFNTNYAASWWLVRSGVELDRNGNLMQASGQSDLGTPCPEPSNKQRASTSGPLNVRLVDTGAAPSSNIPLLGDAGPGDFATGVLKAELGPHSEGSRLTESFSAGPVLNSTMKPPSFSSGTPRVGPNGWWTTWARQTLQDYRAFSPVHSGAANVLMADGSVRAVGDRNGDHLLNTGFDPAAFTGTGDIGFSDKTEELPIEEFFGGYSLKRGEQLVTGQP